MSRKTQRSPLHSLYAAPALLRGMMHPDPTKRLSLEAIKRHRWYLRHNDLLESKSTQCNDPTSLAERLLQGLIMNGEMDYAAPLTAEERVKQLHSDGGRADVPDTVSFTQPEAIQGRTLPLGARDDNHHSMPSSTAAPSRNVRRSDFLESLSQQLTTRRETFAASQSLAGGSSYGQQSMGGDFTQALNMLTQPPTALSRATLTLAPNLTRFLSHSQPSVVAARLMTVFHAMRIQFNHEPLGDSNVDDEAEDRDAMPREDDEGRGAGGGAMDVDSQGGAVSMSRSSSNSDQTLAGNASGGAATATGHTTTGGSGRAPSEGVKGIRIRLGLMDSRKCPLKGEVRIERLRAAGAPGEQEGPVCLVMMRRSRGNPLEWRRVFGKVVKDESVRECVYAGG